MSGRSEHQFHSEREYSSRPRAIYGAKTAGRIAAVVEPYGGVDSGEIRMVEHIERFGAELQVPRFPDTEILEKTKIPLLKSGTDQNVAAANCEIEWLPGTQGPEAYLTAPHPCRRNPRQ